MTLTQTSSLNHPVLPLVHENEVVVWNRRLDLGKGDDLGIWTLLTFPYKTDIHRFFATDGAENRCPLVCTYVFSSVHVDKAVHMLISRLHIFYQRISFIVSKRLTCWFAVEPHIATQPPDRSFGNIGCPSVSPVIFRDKPAIVHETANADSSFFPELREFMRFRIGFGAPRERETEVGGKQLGMCCKPYSGQCADAKALFGRLGQG